MRGLIYKDLAVLKKQMSTLLMFLVVYGGFCVAGVFDFSILGALVAVFGLTVPMSSVAMDDSAHWDRYAVATPAGRRGVVAGKYLFTLLVIGVSTLAAALGMAALSLAGLTEEGVADLMTIAVSCGVTVVLLDAILLPFLLKYGAEKARLISMITFVVIFGGAILLGGGLSSGAPLPTVPEWVLTALPVLLVILAAGGYGVSYAVAQRIYARKEF